MKLKTIQHLLLSLTLLFFTACGSSNGGTDTQSTAIDKLIAFAKDGTPIPTLQDYLDAGVVGVTEANLAEVNEIVSNLTPIEVDSKEKVQAITNSATTGVTLAPTAVATASKTTATQGQNIRFSAEGSTDPDGNIVKYQWKEGNSVLSNISVFDKSNFLVGSHTLILTVTDNDRNTNKTTLKINIKAALPTIINNPPAPASPTISNNPPVATPYTATIQASTNHSFTLKGSDEDNNTLSFYLVTSPSNGTLSGTIPNLIYTPNSNYAGVEVFEFKVNDGTVDSTPSTVTLTVQYPACNDYDVETQCTAVILPLRCIWFAPAGICIPAF